MTQNALSITQSSTLPPAQPTYVLRGHTAQIHAVHLFRDNLRLLSGDADGWIILWDIPIKRPVAVWQAHTNAILGLNTWNEDKIITQVPHGRDNLLQVWQLRPQDEATFSTILPSDDATIIRKQPWLLNSLPVNALNFCSFALCSDLSMSAGNAQEERKVTSEIDPDDLSKENGILLAVPGLQDGHINITALPSEDRVATIPTPKGIDKTGMVMAIRLHFRRKQSDLLVLAGYESGHCCVWRQDHSNTASSKWQTTYTYKAHSQPVLSLDVSPTASCFYSSSADAMIARHPLPPSPEDESFTMNAKLIQTKHAGQQSLTVRSDEKIFATAGWDGRVRVYSARTMNELAVLKWHKEGCYALAFALVQEDEDVGGEDGGVDGGMAKAVVREKRALTVSERRLAKARETHWLVAGSKDGKVSLWDIY